jgi:hypothetical protein
MEPGFQRGTNFESLRRDRGHRKAAIAPDSVPIRSRAVDGNGCHCLNIKQWALNSAVECHPHTVEVVGSNPTAPTIHPCGCDGTASACVGGPSCPPLLILSGRENIAERCSAWTGLRPVPTQFLSPPARVFCFPLWRFGYPARVGSDRRRSLPHCSAQTAVPPLHAAPECGRNAPPARRRERTRDERLLRGN